MLPGAPETVFHAVRIGGQLTCHRALDMHGVWVLFDERLHVAVDRNAARLRDPKDPLCRLPSDLAHVVTHWRRTLASTTRPVATIADALEDLEHCGSFEAFAVALDNSLHRGLVDPSSELARKYAARGLDGVCESGTETLFWLRLNRLSGHMRRQVAIPGVGRVDFLLGDRLVIEIDGREFHDSPHAFERDRRRDAELARLGYRVVRFSYAQVMYDWLSVDLTVRELMAQGEHRARRGSPLRLRDK